MAFLRTASAKFGNEENIFEVNVCVGLNYTVYSVPPFWLNGEWGLLEHSKNSLYDSNYLTVTKVR